MQGLRRWVYLKSWDESLGWWMGGFNQLGCGGKSDLGKACLKHWKKTEPWEKKMGKDDVESWYWVL